MYFIVPKSIIFNLISKPDVNQIQIAENCNLFYNMHIKLLQSKRFVDFLGQTYSALSTTLLLRHDYMNVTNFAICKVICVFNTQNGVV